MRFTVVLEHDSETGHFTATVPGMPGIVVDAKSERSALKLVREAIEMAMKEREADPKRGARPAASLRAKVLSVDV